MANYNNSKPLMKSGRICGYNIWTSDNADFNEAKVYLGWVNPNTYSSKSHSLKFLKFSYFQEIENSSSCFVGISENNLGQKYYRIFKKRSCTNGLFDYVTYPGISCEEYSDLEWLSEIRVFKVFNLLGACSVLIPPKTSLCKNVLFRDNEYDPFSLFRYWPNTEFGHFKDFEFVGGHLFGKKYDGTIDIISRKGEILTALWSNISITDGGISFLNRNFETRNSTFSEIERLYHNELLEISKIQQMSSNPNNIDNVIVDKRDTKNCYLFNENKNEEISWIYTNWKKQFDGTIKIENIDKTITQGELILCLSHKYDNKKAYIIRFCNHTIKYYTPEREFELLDITNMLRKTLKAGRLPKVLLYKNDMSDEEFTKSFLNLDSFLCENTNTEIVEEMEHSKNNENTILHNTSEILTNSNKQESELMGFDFAEKIKQVYKFLSESFTSDKVLDCLTVLFGNNIKNIKGYRSDIDALLESTDLNIAEEIKSKVSEKKRSILTSKQLKIFDIVMEYYTTVKEKTFMEALSMTMDEIKSDILNKYIDDLKIAIEERKLETEKSLRILVFRAVLNGDNIACSKKSTMSIIIGNRQFQLGDIVGIEDLIGYNKKGKSSKRFHRSNGYLFIFLSKEEIPYNGVYDIRGQGEGESQYIGQNNVNGDIAGGNKRIIIVECMTNTGLCKLYDEVTCIDKRKEIEQIGKNTYEVFHFQLKSVRTNN